MEKNQEVKSRTLQRRPGESMAIRQTQEFKTRCCTPCESTRYCCIIPKPGWCEMEIGQNERPREKK